MYSYKDLEQYMKRAECNYDEIKNSNIILFGVGCRYHLIINKLREEGLQIYCASDNDEKKWNTVVDRCRIIAPQDLAKIKNAYVIISASERNYLAIKTQMSEIGIKAISYCDYIMQKGYVFFNKIYKLLDEYSQNVYINVIMHNLKGDASFNDIYSRDQYFCLPEFRDLFMMKHVFVDCGAYVGKTCEDFCDKSDGNIKHIYAFEPYKQSFDALKNRMNRVKSEYGLNDSQVTCENASVGDINGTVGLQVVESSICNFISDSNCDIKIPCVSLDEYFKNGIDIPTLIKADIEGAEQSMIHGSENIIRTYKPMLAICVYHLFSDLFEIPMQILNINPNYKFAIRHHSSIESETVLYAF